MIINTNVRPSDHAAVVGSIDPDAYTANTYESGWINMADFESVLAIVQAGALGTNATINAKLEQAQSSGGAGVKDVAGKAIAELTQAGTDDSDKQALINLYADELDVENGFTHVRLSLTVGTATSDASAVVLGFYPHYGPASDHDLASVAEIV